MADEISIGLSREQALVLFESDREWLARTGAGEQPTVFEEQAEQRVLWDLESVLTEPLREDCRELVAAARARIRDVD